MCANGRSDSRASRIARSRNSCGYFRGAAIQRSPFHQEDHPGIRASTTPGVAHQYRIGALPTGPAVALAGWLRSWLALRVERGDLRDGTVADYRDIIERYLIPRLGQ